MIRNVGGGRPGDIDRSTLGQPGKYTFCFAEREVDSPWEPLHVTRGLDPSSSAVTLFAAEGPRGIVDQLSRDPESLATSFATCLRTTAHPKLALAFDAVLVVSPEHARVFREAGWSKARLLDELTARLQLPGRDLVRGAGGIAEGLPDRVATLTLPKFRDGGPAHRPRRWWRGAVLGHHRGLGQRPDGQRAGDEGGGDMSEARVLLDPTSERQLPTRERTPRPESLVGATVGLLDISKARGDVFLNQLEEHLHAQGVKVLRFAKPTFTKVAPIDLRHEISEQCDVVIEALAD